jgi:hypothetical protein
MKTHDDERATHSLTTISNDESHNIDGGSLKELFVAIVGPWGASLFGITIGSSAAEEIGQ